MAEVLAEVFPLAVAVALSPLPLIAAVVIAIGPSGGPRCTLFLVGRLLGVAVVVGMFTALAEWVADLGLPSSGSGVVRILFGAALMAAGILKWLRRPRGEAADTPPRWLAALEGVSGPRALVLGFSLSALNPKELALGAGAGLAIGGALTQWWPSFWAVTVFAVIGSVTTAVVAVAALVGGEGMAGRLGEARGWLVRNNTTITAVVLVLFGAVLVGNGVG